MRKKDGTHFFCIGMTTALRDDRGRLIGFAKIMQDRTTQHEQAEQLRETTARLSFANQQKDHFLAVLSHELRNPLAPIRNAVYVLRIASADSAPGRRAVDAIDRQSAHLKHLVDDLLDIARIGQGKVGLQMKQVELSGFVRSVAEDHREVFEQSAIELDVERCDEPLYVHADRTRLTQIVGNLLDNARKFTPRGGRVTLAAERSGDEAHIKVSDTGAGMTPDVLATAFEPFVQAEATLAHSIGGLGLGLALVKGLVELHGGRIEAHSLGPERGTDVTVYLPLRAPGEEPQEVEPTEEVLGGACRVLIIEDNADAADMLKTALVMRGHQVRAAHTGQLGLEAAAEFRPEVILCDIGLPDLDGYEVARRIRADRGLAHVHLVALTGHALPEDVERAQRAGFDKHVAKPPDLDALDELISSGR
jgi:signal transduction histidine kinase